MKLTLNRDYLHRHLFAALIAAGLGGWFGYDGLVRYPATPAAELYRKIERADAPAGVDLEAFKAQKTRTQHGFAVFFLLAAAAIVLDLWKTSRFNFSFDDEGFTHNGKRTRYGDIKSVDRSRWKSRDILRVDGIVLDAWHHNGVMEFESKLA